MAGKNQAALELCAQTIVIFPFKTFLSLLMFILFVAGPGGLVVCESAWYSGGQWFDPPARQHSFVQIGHEIISTTILSLPVIQAGQFSVTGESITLSLRSKPVPESVDSLTDRFYMTVVVDLDVKQHSNKRQIIIIRSFSSM